MSFESINKERKKTKKCRVRSLVGGIHLLDSRRQYLRGFRIGALFGGGVGLLRDNIHRGCGFSLGGREDGVLLILLRFFGNFVDRGGRMQSGGIMNRGDCPNNWWSLLLLLLLAFTRRAV